ncbi:MAG: LPS export ABC transporter permease LptF [Phaeovulum sp.]|uniref:LPS export ABC transporter permease LptF n=1 Tax=Phaeovulum sp. TaxID=2934796 RepID=UPI002731A3D1|nr:LPS export ABC transporter permease LptF [Phaeovulum sp.]MDP2063290.1 LPS export ABC transporter permease LptF [Phaeovulum sp.]
MSRLDRYLLAQLMALFGFFALVLVAIYWLNQAVRMFNQLISDGQSARVVLELTSLALPMVIVLLLPLSAFAAAVYVLNRLIGESELVVIQATGTSPWRLARPVLVFGVIVALMMAILVHLLVPMARARTLERRAEIAENVAARFVTEGKFQHPAPGVTFFIREISPRGELLDIYLADSRSSNATVFLASKAVIVRGEAGPKLVMIEGRAQSLRASDGRLSVTRFADFTYDLGALMAAGGGRTPGLGEMTTAQLLRNGSSARGGDTPGAVSRELARRFAAPLHAPVAALIGFAALLLGGFSRLGIWRQIVLAVVLLLVLQSLVNFADTVAQRAPGLWPLIWLPLLGGALAAVAMLWLARRHRRAPGRANRRAGSAAGGAAA